MGGCEEVCVKGGGGELGAQNVLVNIVQKLLRQLFKRPKMLYFGLQISDVYHFINFVEIGYYYFSRASSIFL